MKKKIIAISTLVILALAGGAFYFLKGDKSSQPIFSPVKASLGSIKLTILSTGVVEPKNRLEIKPPIAGRVEEVLVAEGEEVKRGQILAWMSSTERAALLDAARARGAQELKKWSSYYKATPVIAPIDGTIILRSVETGQSFTASDAILVMADVLSVKAQVDETDLAEIELGKAALVTLDAYRDQELSARVTHIAYESTTTNNVTTYDVDVEPLDAPTYMRSGMTANISFITEHREDVVVIPSEAIEQGESPYVLIKGAPKAPPQKRAIETGISDGKMTEVVSGLEVGEEVLVQGLVLPDVKAGGGSPFSRSRGRRR